MHTAKLILGGLVSMLAVTSASADTERTTQLVRGASITAALHHVTDCAITTVGIWGFDEIAKDTAGKPDYHRQVEVYVGHTNWCHPMTWELFGTSDTVEIDGMNSATVDVAFEIPAWVCLRDDAGVATCGEDLGPGSLAVTFTGTGDVVTERWNATYDTGTVRIHDRASTTHRWADVTGSLSLGGANLLGYVMDAELHDVKRGTHTVTRY